MMRNPSFAVSAALTMLFSTTAYAASDGEIDAMKAEIRAMRQSYESRIIELESKLAKIENQKPAGAQATTTAPVSTDKSGRNVYDNSFNPSIGVILNGRYSSFSQDNSGFAGFAIGEEGERGKQGFGVDESELNFSSNVDDKFYGGVTAAIVREGGEDKIELEETFIQTLPGMGLPKGANLKAGRALWTLGYLNEQHGHTDDFADRPLPYRVFLNNGFNDDGAEISYVLPTDFYSEIGGGMFRGDDFPFGGASSDGFDAWSAFARIGGDIGDNQSWRIGAYTLSGDTGGRAGNEDTVNFTGDSNLYAADLRYIWAPTGNSRAAEVTLQGEYFWRNEDGAYEDFTAGTGEVAFDDHASGWYMQGVYKFLPQWRLGYRYSRLKTPDVPIGLLGGALDSGGYNPDAHAVMADWTNSEFSRLRLQYNHEELSRSQDDDQILLQYIMSIGAHGAHKY
ncbi:MAG: hypothetical protein ABL951_14975 [Alphaproteobacteria bacterium]